jgi:ATP/maltotriose-dependent transcriptional regulator MalT
MCWRTWWRPRSGEVLFAVPPLPAPRLLDLGEDLARELGAAVELAFAAFVRGVAFLYRGDPAGAVEAVERAGTLLSTVAKPESGLAWELRLGRLIALGMAAALVGDQSLADDSLHEVLAITEPRGEHHFRSYAMLTQALSAWQQGKVNDAGATLDACLRLKEVPGSADPYGTAQCIEAMAWVAAGQQRYHRAAILLGAANRLWVEIGTPVATFGHMIGHHEACERQARAGLGDAAFTDVFAQGQALSYTDAIAYALNEQREPATSTATEALTPLTRRERQVAGLLAHGLSNKEIASSLVISQRTAESHVEHILTKLGFTSRAQAAAWVTAKRTNDRIP